MASRLEIIARLKSRGYLPHSEGRGSTQFVTFRLADSLPRRVLDEIKGLPKPHHRRRECEYVLDRGLGDCVLGRPDCAQVVRESLVGWLANHGGLLAWVVMPNHVHLVLTLPFEASLSRLMRSLKGFTARRINRLLGREGRLWQPEYFDREMADLDQIEKAVAYTESNPVTAGLCSRAEDWRFSSAGERGRAQA